MKLLLDSHYAFWLAIKRDALTKSEISILADPANELAVSSVAIWELRIKWERRFVSGERKGEANPTDILTAMERLGVPIIDLTGSQAAAVLETPMAHSDPFDELLLAQAQETGMKLFTRDEKLSSHPLALSVI